MNYKVLDETTELIVKGAIECLGAMEILDQETIEHLLIKFDEYLNWIDGNDEHAPELNQKSLFTTFYAFYYGFSCGGHYLNQVSENEAAADDAIKNIMRQ